MELIPFSRCLENKSERKGKGGPPKFSNLSVKNVIKSYVMTE